MRQYGWKFELPERISWVTHVTDIWTKRVQVLWVRRESRLWPIQSGLCSCWKCELLWNFCGRGPSHWMSTKSCDRVWNGLCVCVWGGGGGHICGAVWSRLNYGSMWLQMDMAELVMLKASHIKFNQNLWYGLWDSWKSHFVGSYKLRFALIL